MLRKRASSWSFVTLINRYGLGMIAEPIAQRIVHIDISILSWNDHGGHLIGKVVEGVVVVALGRGGSREDHATQSRAAKECPGIDDPHAVGNHHLAQRCAVLKRQVRDAVGRRWQMNLGDAGTALECATAYPSHRDVPAITHHDVVGQEYLAGKVGGNGGAVIQLIAHGNTKSVGARVIAHMEDHGQHALTGLDEMSEGWLVLGITKKNQEQEERNDSQTLHNENRWADTTMSIVSTCL